MEVIDPAVYSVIAVAINVRITVEQFSGSSSDLNGLNSRFSRAIVSGR